ncbi:hypothetical protein ACIF8Q_07370 [Streptomyces albidoflavus]
MSVPNDRPAAVYRLFAADGTLLYIGSSYDPDHRCKSHRRKPWWPEVHHRTEEWHPRRGAAYRAEMEAIAKERAKYNEMGSPSYRTPDTPAVRSRKLLASARQRLLEESWAVSESARKAHLAEGASGDEAERVGQLAAIDFLDATGLFAGSVKERRRRLGLTS